MVMDRLAKQQIKRKIMFATETDHEKANSIFRGKTLRDDGIVFVKSSLKVSIYVNTKYALSDNQIVLLIHEQRPVALKLFLFLNLYAIELR